MKIIGVLLGEYEGNKYAKCIFTERLTRGGSVGDNAIISKASYQVGLDIASDWSSYENKNVSVFYDRFGRVQGVELV